MHMLSDAFSLPCWRQAPQQFLQALFAIAVARARPLQALRGHLPTPPKGRTVVVGAGKAAAAMAQAVEALWPPEAPLSGVVVTRYGHVPARPAALRAAITVLEAAHPVPDAASVAASQAVLQAVQGLSRDDLVLCLISGGGSSLLSLPAPGLTLAEKQRIHRQLLLSGASIAEMNCLRKHLSAIKGGRLAQACAPAQLLTLAISDVPGDDASIIASGPTVPDASTCAQALEVVQRRGIELPPLAHAALRQGLWESAKPGDACFAHSRFQLVATPRQALEAAAEAARAVGLATYVLADDMEGEARDVALVHAAIARNVQRCNQPFAAPCLLLSGGETTVTVDARLPLEQLGQGGRAGEFGLGLLQALQGMPGIWALAADTDGIDGTQSNAGVCLGPHTWLEANRLGLDVRQALRRHDAFGFFQAVGGLVHTGPTFTNVNDFRALLIDAKPA